MDRKTMLGVMVMLTSPLLMAPHCKSAFPNWPVAPPAPHNYNPVGATGDVPRAFTAAQFRANAQFVEPRLNEAGANSVVALGLAADWDMVEPCRKCNGTNCSTYPDGTKIGWPEGWPNNVADRHVETVGSQSWRCNFNFSYLDAYLDTHVDPYGPRTTRRQFLVQLAPIFHTEKTVPAYLESRAFNSNEMKTSYRRLLGKVMPRIQEHIVAGQNTAAIGLGNEVNAYLNSRADSATAWSQYSNFVADAITYINSPSHLNITNTTETISTQWYGFCGVGDYYHVNPACLAQTNLAAALMASTEILTVTYYPPTTLTSPALGTRIADDMGTMAYLSGAYGRLVLIQEAGYPSDGSAEQNSMQTVFVDKLFQHWAGVADYVAGISYHSVYDFPPTVFWPTGLYSGAGVAKGSNGANWTNFVSKMGSAPP